MRRGNAPRDYQLGPFRYDARVLSIVSTYINHQYEMPLIWGLLDNDEELGRDEAQIAAIIEARVVDVHQLVVWDRLQEGRAVCTCGLVMPDQGGLTDPLGHLDQQRWRPAGCVVARPDGMTGFIAVCQHCAATEKYEELADARAWIAMHRCPDEEASDPPPAGAATTREVGNDLDTVLRERRATRRSSPFHPRAD